MNIDEGNKAILDHLVSVNPKVKKLTYIELGIFLNILGYAVNEPFSLAEAHDYLGGYENELRDIKIKGILANGTSRKDAVEVDKLVFKSLGEEWLPSLACPRCGKIGHSTKSGNYECEKERK